MPQQKTVAFVSSWFAEHAIGAELVDRPGGNEFRALLLPTLSSVRSTEGVSEIVYFLDCGEEVLVDVIKETLRSMSFRPGKVHYRVCEHCYKNVLDKLHDLKMPSKSVMPFACTGPDAVPRALKEVIAHFHKTGETYPPHH